MFVHSNILEILLYDHAVFYLSIFLFHLLSFSFLNVYLECILLYLGKHASHTLKLPQRIPSKQCYPQFYDSNLINSTGHSSTY